MYQVLANNQVRKMPEGDNYSKDSYAYQSRLASSPTYPISGSHPWKEGDMIEDSEIELKEIMADIIASVDGENAKQLGTHPVTYAIPMDTGISGDLEKIEKRRQKIKVMKISGNGIGMSLGEIIRKLPTIQSRDWKGAPSDKHENFSLPRELKENLGLKLQPAFAAWMMGLPEDWTLKPFQQANGEKNQ